MYACDLDDAEKRLHQLRREQREKLALAALTLVLAVAATAVRPELAFPLLLGGVIMGALGVRALWLHWDLLDRLAAIPDALAIAEVRAYASRRAAVDGR